MKKQLHKIKIAAENFSRPAKPDKNSEELLTADRQVEKYKDVLEKISKKFTQNTSGSSGSSNANVTAEQEALAREKRCKKVHEFRLAQAMEESIKDLPDGLLRDVLENAAKLEKNIASEIINNEINVEIDVTKKLNNIIDNHITTIQKQKRIVTKLMQDNESAKHKYQAALRVNENPTKITQLREEQEECETKLEKERDIWATEMFELIAEEENMANYIINYIKYQQLYYRSALDEIEHVMERVNGLLKGNNKRIYKIPLDEHLAVTNRTISYVIELCVCCLLEKGLYEEGLLRVGCAGTKLKRLRSAIDANFIGSPFPSEYQDVHVIAGVLKSYLRDLPDPLLTYRLYDEFVSAALRPSEDKRKNAILNAVNQLPNGHYYNLRYLTKFLSLLAQKSQHNKMSSQNIAIVMSPNLLWPPDSHEIDYVQKVNSSAAVNTIVEMLVSDWGFFFDGDVDFYVTMTRDELFPDNGGFAYDRDPPDAMTKSMTAATGASLSDKPKYQTHSRSSSHDTSQILYGDQIKRSQSSSSLSDNNSSPPQSSPKLPVRRKHNKQAAPTPPDIRFQHKNHHHSGDGKTKSNNDQYHHGTGGDDDESYYSVPHASSKSDGFSQTGSMKPPLAAKRIGSNENLSKPEKPPRPALISTECQTLNRHSYRTSKGVDRSMANKPVAMPRNILNITKSNENLADSTIMRHAPNAMAEEDLDDPVIFREKTDDNNKPDKPAIPERPVTLMRPPSFKGVLHENHINVGSNDGGGCGGIKKNSSFRSQSGSQNSLQKVSVNGGSLTTLERTHIYNVDKKQVAIIDVGDNMNNNNNNNTINKTTAAAAAAAAIVTTVAQQTPTSGSIGSGSSGSGSGGEVSKSLPFDDKQQAINDSTVSVDQSTGTGSINPVPPSPRGFDPKIKRPQIPAPPPPVNRPKSDGSGDSTQL